ncbi:MAG TPA: M23 family metallopeptidase [Azospirillum sp.]|nr:M23 family metallopeptidase [Azospirillum sp.]
MTILTRQRPPFRRAILAALLLVLGVAGSALAAPPSLGIPIDCAMGERCFIQNYVDHESGPGRRDYACGRLSYDGHTGTDFRLPDLPAMEKGVPVVAAAAGVVQAARDEVPDVDMRDVEPEAIRNRELGNAVILDHGDGWQTSYGHLRRGSVVVKPGERVEAGRVLGMVGLSGKTMFPHVHFEVRQNSRPVDPFVGPTTVDGCAAPRQPLWSAGAQAKLAYQESAGLVAGFATQRPDAEQARRGAYRDEALGPNPETLVYWVDVLGTIAGDETRFRIMAPDGRVILDNTARLDGSNVSWFGFNGVKRPPTGWSPGSYRGSFTLTRRGKTVVELERRVELR